MTGPHVPLQPRRQPASAIRSRRARSATTVLHLDEPGEPRAAPERRQRRLGPRPARLLDPALLARRESDARCRRSAAAASSRASPTSRSSTSSSRSGTIAHVELSWLAPSKLRRTTIVGSREDDRLRRHEHRARADLRLGRAARAARDVRRVPAQLPHGRHRLAAPRGRRAAARARCWTSARRRGRRHAALVRRARARGRPRDRGGRAVARAAAVHRSSSTRSSRRRSAPRSSRVDQSPAA